MWGADGRNDRAGRVEIPTKPAFSLLCWRGEDNEASWKTTERFQAHGLLLSLFVDNLFFSISFCTWSGILEILVVLTEKTNPEART